MTPTFPKVGLGALLTPENCAVLLIDHQPSQLANVNSHDPTLVINNVTALAKTAKAYGVPTILTTINSKRGGEIFKQVQAVFPDQKPIDRSFINSWEDRRVVEAVKDTGRKKLVIAALWSEMCLAQPAIHAMGDGYDVYAVTDASGGVTPEAHDMAIRRLIAVGIAGGLGLFFNLWTSYIADMLIVFLIFATATVHGPLVRDPVTGTDQIVHMITNVAIIGGSFTFVAF